MRLSINRMLLCYYQSIVWTPWSRTFVGKAAKVQNPFSRKPNGGTNRFLNQFDEIPRWSSIVSLIILLISFGKILFKPPTIWHQLFKNTAPEARAMHNWSQMQGGQNWILPKEINANRFFWDSHWLEIWKSQVLCPSMGPNRMKMNMLESAGWVVFLVYFKNVWTNMLKSSWTQLICA
jgi:hypothetical protein